MGSDAGKCERSSSLRKIGVGWGSPRMAARLGKEWNSGGYQSATGRVGAPAPDRRLLAVNAPPMTPAARRSTSPSATHALPLSQLLGHAADAVQAVRRGESPTNAL